MLEESFPVMTTTTRLNISTVCRAVLCSKRYDACKIEQIQDRHKITHRSNNMKNPSAVVFFLWFCFRLLNDVSSSAFIPTVVSFLHPQSVFSSRDACALFAATTKTILSIAECQSLLQFRSVQEVHVQFVDGTWYHHKNPTTTTTTGRMEYERGPRIPGAVYFDIDEICTPHETLSHMFPTPEIFATAMDRWNITTDHHHVIIYGRQNAPFLARIWFTFRILMGHERVSLMQGSLEEWIQQGGTIETHFHTTTPIVTDAHTKTPTRTMKTHKYQPPHYNPHVLVDCAFVQQNVLSDPTRTLLLDARKSSFTKQGHIPGSFHVPYDSIWDNHHQNHLLQPSSSSLNDNNAEMHCLKSVPELLQLLFPPGRNPMQNPQHDYDRIVITCGSGVSVCNLYLALYECGITDILPTYIYDSSWQEWGSRTDTPKVLTNIIVPSTTPTSSTNA
jgi:thiosulfate/3-mercaptopyruvate sulfurtransferase